MDNIEIIKDIVAYSEISGENVIDILANMDDDKLNDYLRHWKELVSEEMSSRIETGVAFPIKFLQWFPKGKGWAKLNNEEVPF